MKLTKIAKYVLVTGMIGAIAIAPASRVIAAVSGEELSTVTFTPGPTAEEVEQARQEAEAEAYHELVAEATAPVNQTVAAVSSQVEGFYLARGVQGVAFTAPAAAEGAQAPADNSFVKIYDTDKRKSTAAVSTANAVAATLGGEVGPCINVSYGTMTNGRFVRSTEGSAKTMNIGIPQSFRTEGATYAIAAIYAGGQYKIFENTSQDPAVITVDVEEAISPDVMYALIKY